MSDMYEETVASQRDTLTRNGFVRCDIPACNCGSWHHRYGLPERFEQIRYMLAEAGYELCNENGHLVSKALAQLISDLAAAKEDADYAWRNVRILEAARVEESARFRQDAARYRHIRSYDTRLGVVAYEETYVGTFERALCGDELDAAVDAEIALMDAQGAVT